MADKRVHFKMRAVDNGGNYVTWNVPAVADSLGVAANAETTTPTCVAPIDPSTITIVASWRSTK